MQFVYKFAVHQSEDGAWQVRFPDVPEALTEGKSEDEACALAQEALLAALGGLCKLGKPIPAPVSEAPFEVVVPLLPAAKLALYLAMREQGFWNAALARKMNVSETVIRRMLDFDRETRISRLEEALWCLGKQIVCEVRPAE